MENRRSKKTDNRYSNADSLDYSFNQYAGALKTLPVTGYLKPLGAANVVLRVELGSLVALYNNSASTAFAKIGDPVGLTAPSGGADGICLRPNDYTILSVGEYNGIIASAATVFAYLVVDDTMFQKNTGVK